MNMRRTIALVGDRDERIVAHRAIEAALPLVARALDADIDGRWLATESIGDAALRDAHGIWCVPGSPYRSMDGALHAIRHARTRGVPFLGTCGGFQHAVIEYARAALGWADAEHAESAPDAAHPVVSLLACSLVEASETVRLVPGTRIAQAYGTNEAHEGYHCRYGLNPAFAAALLAVRCGPARSTPTMTCARSSTPTIRSSSPRCSSPSAPPCAAPCRRWCARSRRRCLPLRAESVR